MKKWVFLFIIFIVGILEASVLNDIKIFNIKPDFLLIAVVAAALNFDSKWTFVLSLFAGIMKDIFGINKFGLNVLLFPLWAFAIMRLSRKISIESNFMRVVLVFIISIFHNMIARAILVSSRGFLPVGIYLPTLLFESAYTALISPLFFKVIMPPAKVSSIEKL